MTGVPILHFFDGFRTSHEITKVVPLDDETLRSFLDSDAVRAHRARALDPDHPVDVPTAVSAERRRAPAVPARAPDFVQRVTRLLIEGRGDELPVSAFPPDGTWPSGTSQFEKRALALEISIWQPDICVQCNFCSMICPHTAIQTKVFDPAQLANAPASFRSVPEAFEPALDGLHYAVQVAQEDCTGCGLCIEVCPAKDRLKPRRKVLVSKPLANHREA